MSIHDLAQTIANFTYEEIAAFNALEGDQISPLYPACTSGIDPDRVRKANIQVGDIKYKEDFVELSAAITKINPDLRLNENGGKVKGRPVRPD